jgi:hypothetical protein
MQENDSCVKVIYVGDVLHCDDNEKMNNFEIWVYMFGCPRSVWDYMIKLLFFEIGRK